MASEPDVPEPVMLAMQEITADISEGLLAMAVGTGLQVMAAMMEGRRDRGVRTWIRRSRDLTRISAWRES